MTVVRIAPDSPGARKLLALSDQYMAALYPAESNHMESVDGLRQPNVCFLGIEEAGEVVACGAVKRLDDGVAYGEIKRLFVLAQHRSRGFARSIMCALEDELRQHAVTIARLEVGISQPEAIGLYRSLGYQRREPFGNYVADPWSVFMEKVISGSPR